MKEVIQSSNKRFHKAQSAPSVHERVADATARLVGHRLTHTLLALYLQAVSAEVLMVKGGGLATRANVLDFSQGRENVGHFIVWLASPSCN